MILNGVAAARKVSERMTMGGKHRGDPFELGNFVEVMQVVRQGIAAHEASDVWGDRGQHMVSRKQYPIFGVPHA